MMLYFIVYYPLSRSSKPVSDLFGEVKTPYHIFSVKEPREAALDSGVVEKIAQMGRMQAQALHTDFQAFEPAEFADKLVIKWYHYSFVYTRKHIKCGMCTFFFFFKIS